MMLAILGKRKAILKFISPAPLYFLVWVLENFTLCTGIVLYFHQRAPPRSLSQAGMILPAFSAPPPQGIFGSVWRIGLVIIPGGWGGRGGCWHPMSRGQGCCWISRSAQFSPLQPRLIQPQMSIVPRLGNLVLSHPWCLRNDLFYDLCIAFFPSTSVGVSWNEGRCLPESLGPAPGMR